MIFVLFRSFPGKLPVPPGDASVMLGTGPARGALSISFRDCQGCRQFSPLPRQFFPTRGRARVGGKEAESARGRELPDQGRISAGTPEAPDSGLPLASENQSINDLLQKFPLHRL